MKVLEGRLMYLFILFCKDLLCSYFHFGSRTFICMFNIFVFPSPLTLFVVILRNMGLLVLFHSRCYFQNWCVFKCIPGNQLGDKVLIQIWNCIVRPSWTKVIEDLTFLTNPTLSNAFQANILVPRSSIQLGNDLYLSFWGICTPQMSCPESLHKGHRMVSPIRTIRDVCDFNFWFALSSWLWRIALFLSGVFCGFHTCILRISWRHESNIDLKMLFLRASHRITILCFPTLWTSGLFSESPGYFSGLLWLFQFLSCFATTGQTHVYPRWVMCAIWIINGSELFDPTCFEIEDDISSRWKSAMSLETMAVNIHATV